jgi:hypothetical protein
MRLFVILLACLATITLSDFAIAQGTLLPRSTPEAQGVSSERIREFIKAADQQVDSIHSFMLVQHGHVVAEAWRNPEAANKPHVLWSLSKSFTSTAVGLAVAEGKLDINDPVLSFFPKDAPHEPSANLKAMRIRNLLTMSTGNQDEVRLRGVTDWTRAFLHHFVPQPGTHFKYNTPATYMLSAIVQQITWETTLEYLTPDCLSHWILKRPNGTAVQRESRLGAMGCSCVLKISPNLASCIFRTVNGTASSSFQQNGSDKPLANRFPMGVIQRATVNKATASSFGDAATEPFGATARMASFALCSLVWMPWSQSHPTPIAWQAS